MNPYDVAQFLIDQGLHNQMEYSGLAESIKGHIKYNTITMIGDMDAVAIWNMDTPEVAHVIDVAIKKKNSSKYLIQLIKLSVGKFPTIKYLRFERGLKGKKMKLVKVSRFLKEK